jgi:hypothetical protein
MYLIVSLSECNFSLVSVTYLAIPCTVFIPKANNNLSAGTMPTEIGLMTSLVKMNLQSNNLFGTIPSEIGLMPMLQYAWFKYNDLTGTVPFEVCNILLMNSFGDLASVAPPYINHGKLLNHICPGVLLIGHFHRVRLDCRLRLPIVFMMPIAESNSEASPFFVLSTLIIATR